MGRNYKNLVIWKFGYDICLKVYKLTKKFPEDELNILVNQVKRAAISIPSNIAEGTCTPSDKSFIYYLSYAYGSAREVSVQMCLAKDLNYISSEDFLEINKLLDKFQAMIYKFMRTLSKDTSCNNFFKKLNFKRDMENNII